MDEKLAKWNTAAALSLSAQNEKLLAVEAACAKVQGTVGTVGADCDSLRAKASDASVTVSASAPSYKRALTPGRIARPAVRLDANGV